jgi:hypothetical protein
MSDFKIRFISYKILQDRYSVRMTIIPCNTSDQTETAVKVNQQYRIVLVCKADDAHEIMDLLSSRYVWKIYILGEYNTKNVKIETVHGDEKDLMWYLINQEIDHLHEQEHEYRKHCHMCPANLLGDEILILFDQMDEFIKF